MAVRCFMFYNILFTLGLKLLYAVSNHVSLAIIWVVWLHGALTVAHVFPLHLFNRLMQQNNINFSLKSCVDDGRVSLLRNIFSSASKRLSILRFDHFTLDSSMCEKWCLNHSVSLMEFGIVVLEDACGIKEEKKSAGEKDLVTFYIQVVSWPNCFGCMSYCPLKLAQQTLSMMGTPLHLPLFLLYSKVQSSRMVASLSTFLCDESYW